MALSCLLRASLFALGLAAAAGAQCSSAGAVLWNASTRTPPTGTHTVAANTTEFDDNPSLNLTGTLTVAGTLYFDCSNNISLTYDSITISSTGKLEIGATSSGVTTHITAKRIEVYGTLQIGTTA